MAKNRLETFLIIGRRYMWRVTGPNPRAALEKARRYAEREGVALEFKKCFWQNGCCKIRVSVGHNGGASRVWRELLNERA